MRKSRLFRIVYYLLENEKATAPELAQKFEVSIRTIYRDIDAISSTGIPIYAPQGMTATTGKNSKEVIPCRNTPQKVFCGQDSDAGVHCCNNLGISGFLARPPLDIHSPSDRHPSSLIAVHNIGPCMSQSLFAGFQNKSDFHIIINSPRQHI